MGFSSFRQMNLDLRILDKTCVTQKTGLEILDVLEILKEGRLIKKKITPQEIENSEEVKCIKHKKLRPGLSNSAHHN